MRIIVLVATVLLANAVHAQSNCATALARATTSYESGNITEVESILAPCVQELRGEDKWKAYRLLALAYLFQNERRKADGAIEAMLQLNPRYDRFDSRDPEEFSAMLYNYSWYPEFSVSGNVGANLASPTVLRNYSVGSAQATSSMYSGAVGTSFGLMAEYRVNDRVAIDAGVAYFTSAFSRQTAPADKFSTEYSEHLSYITIPAGVRYQFGGVNIVPFAIAGLFGQFSPAATAAITSTDDKTVTTTSTTGIATSARRTSVAAGLYIGAGAAYPMNNGELSVSLRYLHGISDVVNGTQRYANSNLVYGYYFVDDDFAMKNFELSVSFSYYLSFHEYKLQGEKQ